MTAANRSNGEDGTLGIVIPAFNPDPDRLVNYVDAIDRRIDPATVRIELDAPDKSLLAALDGVRATLNTVSTRRGKGAAITAGFEALDTDVLAFADADGATPVDDLAVIVDAVAGGETDLAIGSRRHPDATVRSHQTIGRRYLGDLFAWFARRLLEVKVYDYQCGAKAISAATWRRVRTHLREPGFAWDIELLALTAARGGRIEEIPIEWHDRSGSTVDPIGTPLELGRALFSVRHRSKRIGGSRLHRTLARGTRESPRLIEQWGTEDSP